MRTCIVSDSHGDKIALSKVCQFSINLGIDAIFHLGDDTKDLDYIVDLGINIFSVPGTRDSGYGNPEKTCLLINEGKHFISLSHLFHDKDPKADIIIYGHTHIPHIENNENRLYINPGHVINNKMRFPQSSFIILYLDGTEVKITLYNWEYFGYRVS